MRRTSLVSAELLNRLAAILEVDESKVRQLGESVSSALRDYEATLRTAPLKPKEVRATFDQLVRKAKELRQGFTDLRPAEIRALEEARELAAYLHSQRELLSLEHAIQALQSILVTLRHAKKQVPKPRRGRPPNTTRYLLVSRLAACYSRARSHKDASGNVLYELPRREHDREIGEDVGRFRDFVIAAMEPLADLDDGKGIDDVIRSVCAPLGKRATRENE